MRAEVRSEVAIAAPAGLVWDYVTDWARQGEWIPLTRVEAVDEAGREVRVGGRVRARTGVGPVGFWDPMTITAVEHGQDGSGRCEVLHTGGLVRGEGEFAVEGTVAGTCRFVWWERLALPLGPLGALGWLLTGWAARRGIDQALGRCALRAEAVHGVR
jgi:hypothetical protein